MKALLIYNKEDYDRNNEYVNWIIDTAQKKGIAVVLVFKDELLLQGTNLSDDISFVINRTRCYEISLIFELNNIRVFNNSVITLIGNNKLACYNYAKNKGYKFPDIFISWDDKQKVISKPNFGHGGYGIGMLNEIDLNDGTYRFQQKLVENLVGDIRFFVIGNKIIHAVLRKQPKGKIISNFSQGGDIELYHYNNSEKDYVEKFISDLNIDYAGVDFLLTKSGELIFNEIEDVVGSRMLSCLGINDTTDLYIDHIINIINKK